MATEAQTQQQAIDAIAAVEKSIIEHAERQQVHGVRLEWNEDLDFGHLMVPVPVVAITREGNLWVWDARAPADGLVEWGSFRHDARNSGRYP